MTRATSRRSFLKSSAVGASAAAATLAAPAVAHAGDDLALPIDVERR